MYSNQEMPLGVDVVTVAKKRKQQNAENYYSKNIRSCPAEHACTYGFSNSCANMGAWKTLKH